METIQIMTPVAEHYEKLLAPIYVWMVGGSAEAFTLGERDLVAELPTKGRAIDLGSGFGMHTIPLARAGWHVLAVDSSPLLLDLLTHFSKDLHVNTYCEDMLGFARHSTNTEPVELVLCMGDTLTHLSSCEEVDELSKLVFRCLVKGGRFIATFRDYTQLPNGNARFIPVRADSHRILTCFLEEQDGHVQVHDILYEHSHGIWKTNISSYRKLRLMPEWVRQVFQNAGFRATIENGPRGMLRLIADV